VTPINYLRGVVRRDQAPAVPAATEPEPKQPREIPWANPAHTIGACTHDVIYSRCNCEQQEHTKQQ